MTPRNDRGPRILFAPDALLRLGVGVDRMAALMAATIGPSPGIVLNARNGGSVEVLSDAGTIARRIVEIPGRAQNTGAMILRNLAWRMHEQYGDGAATAAVLAATIVREATKRIDAGVDPVLIRDGLQHGLSAAICALTAQAEPASGQHLLSAVATGITGDPALGNVLGEIVDLLGPDAALTVEEYPVAYLDREYIEGSYWRAHPATRAMIPEGRTEVVLADPSILLVDQRLDHVEDVVPALDLIAQSPGRHPLLIVAPKMADRALNALTLNHARGTIALLAAVLSTVGPALTDDLGDIAALTGGTVLADILGRPPRRLTAADLGTAQKAVLTRDSLTLAGGAGDSAAIAERSAQIQRRMSSLSPNDAEWQRQRGRAARLGGGVAILKIGSHSKPDLAHRRAQAEKAFHVLTGMLAGGVVPGGGVAFLDCIPAVRAARTSCPLPGQEHGVDILVTALEAPFAQIVRNAGRPHPPVALAEVKRLGEGYGLDVTTGAYVSMREQGILDSLLVARGALQAATSAAISVLTTSAVVLPAAAKRGHRVQP